MSTESKALLLAIEKMKAENYRLRDQMPGSDSASKKNLLPGDSGYGIGDGEVYTYGHTDAETQTEPSEAEMGVHRSVTGKELGKPKSSVSFQNAASDGGEGEGETADDPNDGVPKLTNPETDALARQSKKLCPLAKLATDLKGKTKLSVETALNTLHDLYEKKCIADLTDYEQNNERDSMVDFLQDYFLHEYGLQKLAEKKLKIFLHACMKFSKVRSTAFPTLQAQHQSQNPNPRTPSTT